MYALLLIVADSVCNHAAIAAQNQGSPYFQCPLAQNADNENRCCGDPGEQTCCADPAVDPPFLSEIDGELHSYLVAKDVSARMPTIKERN